MIRMYPRGPRVKDVTVTFPWPENYNTITILKTTIVLNNITVLKTMIVPLQEKRDFS